MLLIYLRVVIPPCIPSRNFVLLALDIWIKIFLQKFLDLLCGMFLSMIGKFTLLSIWSIFQCIKYFWKTAFCMQEGVFSWGIFVDLPTRFSWKRFHNQGFFKSVFDIWYDLCFSCIYSSFFLRSKSHFGILTVQGRGTHCLTWANQFHLVLHLNCFKLIETG